MVNTAKLPRWADHASLDHDQTPQAEGGVSNQLIRPRHYFFKSIKIPLPPGQEFCCSVKIRVADAYPRPKFHLNAHTAAPLAKAPAGTGITPMLNRITYAY